MKVSSNDQAQNKTRSAKKEKDNDNASAEAEQKKGQSIYEREGKGGTTYVKQVSSFGFEMILMDSRLNDSDKINLNFFELKIL